MDDTNRWSDGTRITTVHDRYEVGDDDAGEMIETYGSREDAVRAARAALARRPKSSRLEIHDRMARRDQPRVWHVLRDGSVVAQPRSAT